MFNYKVRLASLIRELPSFNCRVFPFFFSPPFILSSTFDVRKIGGGRFYHRRVRLKKLYVYKTIVVSFQFFFAVRLKIPLSMVLTRMGN